MYINITDINSMIKEYMIARLKESNPNLDTSENSPVMDLFISPMQTIMQPLITSVNSLEVKQNLNNADYMTEDELDEIGVGNYLLARNPGLKATAIVTLSFTTISSVENLIIPEGVTFSTASGIQFINTSSKQFTPAELYSMLNSSTMYYDVDINVEAADVGADYNVDVNQITVSDITFNVNLIAVTNKTAAYGGTDQESNSTYAQRMKEYYLSRHLGTSYGYNEFIMENFTEVQDVYVAGFEDEYMTRDIVLVYDAATNTPVGKHIGGKIDIYIKGCSYNNQTVSVNINSNKLSLLMSYDSVHANSISATNITDNTKIVTYTLSKDLNTGKAILTLLNPDSSHMSYDPAVLSNISISYSYTDNYNNTANQTEVFSVGLTEVELSTPFKSIINIEDPISGDSYIGSGNYTITQTGLVGSSNEVTTLTFNPIAMNSLINGTSISIEYMINSTINGLEGMFNYDETRIITTDLLFKEAQPVYINIAFKVKLVNGETLDDFKVSAIESAIASFFETTQLGYQVQESDIVSYLYQDANVGLFLDFIALPFDSFYVPNNIADPISLTSEISYIDSSPITYPALNKLSVTAL